MDQPNNIEIIYVVAASGLLLSVDPICIIELRIRWHQNEKGNDSF